MTDENTRTIRFASFDKQPTDDPGKVCRVVGFCRLRYLAPLFFSEALEPNPRSAQVGKTTTDIRASLDHTPELFRFKSKGLLVAAASVRERDRGRFELRFENSSLEGILDGGHNTLALGLFLLEELLGDKQLRTIKGWRDLISAIEDNRSEFDAALKGDRGEVLVPVELLMPSDPDADTVETFLSALVDICAARNNNAQLKAEALSNRRGFYEAIREYVPRSVDERTAWKTGTWDDESEKRPINPRDLVALGWIPLNLLSIRGGLPAGEPFYKVGDEGAPAPQFIVSPQNIYRNKGECSKRFDALMEDEAITTEETGSKHVLTHEGVRSALKILGDLPELYDLIYERFPSAYNAGGKRFGANPIVKVYDPVRRDEARRAGKTTTGFIASHPITPFMRREVRKAGNVSVCSYPDGLIMPLVYGLQGLMEVVEGRVLWAVDDPAQHVVDVLPDVAAKYRMVLDFARWDPQKIAKNPDSHEFAVQQFHASLA